ncbi:HAD family hydrolase [Gorillibacterium sp. CAU 1737]|uniref:HAD family hydrolase n=1 Tax=Gorillibacterium sp. CAU 1737 TaxID=3140362 RepID=UPI00326118E7
MSIEEWKRNGPKKAVFFDLNGTLIDPEASYEAALAREIRELAARSSAADRSEWEREALAQYRKERQRLTAGPTARRTVEAKALLRRACLAKAVSALPVPRSSAFLLKLDRAIKESLESDPRLYAGTLQALEAIGRGRKIALISNGSRLRLEGRVKRARLEAFFPPARLFTAGAGQRGKPHPDLFQQALETLSLSPSDAMMVGDSRTKDTAGALRVGMDACWFRPGKLSTVTAVRRPGGWLLQAGSLQQLAHVLE